MKRILVKSLFDCFDYVVDGPSEDTLAILSIQNSKGGGFGFRFTENARNKAVLTLLFDDIEQETAGMVLFSSAQAREIIRFILANRSVDTLLIHCYAGMSRSRAVGAFAVKLFGKDNAAYFQTGVPNRHVYDTLEQEWQTYLANR